MQIIEKLGTISNTITKMFNFVHTSPTVQEDFDDFLKTIGAKNADINSIQAEILPYILERRIGEDRKSIPDLYLEENLKIDSVEKEIITALKDNVYSVFEIKKILKNAFILTNLIDEKEYEVLPLVKMTNFRGVFAEQYMVARIFKYENEYYLIEVANILPKSQKEEVMRYAVAKIIEEPERAYLNNPEKFKELKEIINVQYNKFIECFGHDELIMSNKNADTIISMFNDFYESDVKPTEKDLEGKLEYNDELKYFEVKEFNNSYEDFLEKSVGGFSSHTETYDVAVIYDNAHGLFVIPFYATFSKIFESDDYKQIENYKECLLEMLENDKVSSSIIERVANKYSNFIERVNEILEENYTLDSLFKKYKPEFLEKEILSSTTVLYNSKVFAEVMGFMVQEEMMSDVVKPDTTVKVGRNDPCPCGSGKKYKKCCGKV